MVTTLLYSFSLSLSLFCIFLFLSFQSYLAQAEGGNGSTLPGEFPGPVLRCFDNMLFIFFFCYSSYYHFLDMIVDNEVLIKFPIMLHVHACECTCN